MTQYRKKGQIDLLEKVPQKPKKKFDWDGLFGGLFLIIIVAAIIGNISE